VVVTTPAGERVFRSMAPIENSAECAQCHDGGERLIGMLLIDVSVVPFTERLAAYLRQNLVLWLTVIASTMLVVYFVIERLVLSRLADVVRAIGRMSRGIEPPPVPEGSPDEIGLLARAFNRMAHQIESRNSQNQALSAELQQQSQQRGRLLRRLITAQEDERIRVARELHDELGQSLTGLSLRAQALERYLPPGDEQGSAILEQIRSLITGTTEQMYDIIMALRPSILDDLGLVSALRAYAERTLAGSDLAFEIDDRCFHNRLPPAVETALFRAFQEGITNVLRHAGATQIRVTLACADGFFEGELADDGRGFEPALVAANGHDARGLGLLGMQERITQCGGEMEIVSAPGQGTRIRFLLPLEEVVSAPED
jgi:signal transduction histidine kinase